MNLTGGEPMLHPQVLGSSAAGASDRHPPRDHLLERSALGQDEALVQTLSQLGRASRCPSIRLKPRADVTLQGATGGHQAALPVAAKSMTSIPR